MPETLTRGRLWLFASLLMPGLALALPTFNEVSTAYRSSDAVLLARDSRPLHTLRLDKNVRRLEWTPLSQISPALVRAVIVSEDKRFMEHDGVDWQAAGKAAWSNFWGGRTRGASTLTMQLTGLIDEDGRQRGRRSIFDKISQSTAAIRLDSAWNKRQIIEAYLNLVSFRGELQGVSAMSRQLFGKWPHGLDERESALAAALLRSPNASPELVARRACNLLKEMNRERECVGLESFTALALSGGLRPTERDPEASLAPHLARKLLDQPGSRLRSSLDADLQQFAFNALRHHLTALSRQNAEDGAVIVIDNASGEILAWVGSSGDLSGASEVDGVTSLRQAGSTLKPFLYALAFERRNLTPASLIEDAPLSLDTGNGLYTPQNYDPDYHGWVSVRMALGGSLNVPAVKTLVRVGANRFHERLKQTGFASLKESGDWYGYSLALGSADVSLLMLANGYRTLANGGRWSPLRATPGRDEARIPCRNEGCAGVFTDSAHTAFTPASAYLAGNILADRNARASTFGLESWLATPYWAAAKTGTSKDMRDNWCAGYSQRYTVAVWVGNASGSPMHDVSGISGAAPVWREVMDWLHRGDPKSARKAVASRAPAVPAGVVQARIRFEPAHEPPRDEWFIAGTEMPVIRAAAADALARIEYPANSSIIALDPDIPPQRQRIPLRLSGPAAADWRWHMDGKALGKAGPPLMWLPQPGRHQLTIRNRRGEILSIAEFEVRAMKGRTH